MNKYVLSIQQTCLIPHVIRKDIIDRKKEFHLSPPFRAILSFSRCAHWLSCCAHGGFFVRLGVEEWERWATWGGVRCGAVASALLRQSRDTAEALSEMFYLPRALRRKAEHIALDFRSIRSIVTAHRYEPDVGGFCSDFTTGNEDKMVAFSHFLRF